VRPTAAVLALCLARLPAAADEPALADPVAVTPHARAVVAAVVEAARANTRRPRRGEPGAGPPFRRAGDDLTDYYARAAAAAAGRVPAEHAPAAFLLGLGVALDDSDLLRDHPLTRDLWRRLEPAEERARRLEVLGTPTLHGRHDLCQHFAVSGALTALAGPQAAEAAGLLKEMLDARPGGSGFSFADLAADWSGVAFAAQVLRSPRRLATLADSFAAADFALPPAGLPEGLSQADFARRYGSAADERFRRQEREIRRRIAALPGYRE
jgi:hypothetical protein